MFTNGLILLTLSVLQLGLVTSLNVLFIGNSFTFVNDLPGTFKALAASKGKMVTVNSSTIGGCSLFYQKDDAATTKLLQSDWDFIILQDYSQLPTVATARAKMMFPAVKEIAGKKGDAKIVLYNTWGYFNGTLSTCPDGSGQCFPLGSLTDLTSDCKTSARWKNQVDTFECMTYSLARGYMAAMDQGGDRLAPCGLAWETARKGKKLGACKSAIDAEYDESYPLDLPIEAPDAGDASHIMLYLEKGKNKHPTLAGQYLNAAVFYVILFKDSPEGAEHPRAISQQDAKVLQEVAAGVVLPHIDTWIRN